MEAVFGKALAEMIKLGGGYLMAAVVLWLYIRLWTQYQALVKGCEERQDKINDRLIANAETQTKAMVEVGSVLSETVKTMESVDQTTRILADRSGR